ncbi:hypothetical protein ACLOJK_013362 [Asimina triloba]
MASYNAARSEPFIPLNLQFPNLELRADKSLVNFLPILLYVDEWIYEDVSRKLNGTVPYPIMGERCQMFVAADGLYIGVGKDADDSLPWHE